MKRYLKDFKFTQDFIILCMRDCLQKRWSRTDTAYFFAEYILKINPNKGDIHSIAKKCKEIAADPALRYKFEGLIKYIANELYEEIIIRKIKLDPIKYETRHDSSSGKERIIGIASIKQQIYDYIAVNACKGMFHAKIGFYQCASLPGKGQLFGKTAIESWIRKEKASTKYAYKCDIKKCYPNIDHNKIKKLLARDIKNTDVLYVLFTLIDTYDKGLCIGSYLSQYLANYYLSYAYHYITEQSFTIRKHKDGTTSRENHVSHILFYMDDIIVFSGNKKYLKRAVEDLVRFLNDFLLLTIKPNGRLFKVDGDKIDMMGFIITRKYTAIRKRIFLRICRAVRHIRRNHYKMSYTYAKKFISYYGWIKHSNSFNFSRQYNINKILSVSKKVVSNNEKSSLYGKAA